MNEVVENLNVLIIMKNTKILLFGICLLITGFSFSQQTSKKMMPVTPLSGIERYKIDYELVNYTFVDGDSSVLNLIDLEHFDVVRKENQDIEITDSVTGLKVLIYSKVKAREKKSVNKY